MPPEDFDEWFVQVKHLAGTLRLRPADPWCGDETWQDAFLGCLTPAEAIAGVSIPTPESGLPKCPKLRVVARWFKLLARAAGGTIADPASPSGANAI
jgi:hypothetical protein